MLKSSYFFTSRWLEYFASRISIDVWTFLIAFTLIILVSIATVAVRTFTAASTNPMEALKTE